MNIDTNVSPLGQTYAGDGVTARSTTLGSLAVAQAEAPNTDRARAGRRFHGGCGIIANAIAPVQAIPTTTATLALYNANDTLALAIDRLAIWLASGTAAAGLTLLACVSPAKVATPVTANATGYSSGPTRAGGPSSGAFWGTAVTLPAGAVWVPILSNFQLAAANVGQGDQAANLFGSLIVPPG